MKKSITLAVAMTVLTSLSLFAQVPDPDFKPIFQVRGTVTSVAAQADGKIVVGGDFSTINLAENRFLARLNADGSIDPSFNIGTGPNAPAYCVLIQDDGKILVTGDFQTFNGVPVGNIMRLNADGSIDETFSTSSTSFPMKLALQSDGKMLTYRRNLSTSSGKLIRRFLTSGEADETLALHVISGVNAVLPQADGKIVIAGTIQEVNEQSVNRIARVNSDGSLDETFLQNIGTGFDNDVNFLGLQSDGSIIAAGNFTSVNGHPVNRVARILPDGTVDTGFSVAEYTQAPIQGGQIQNDDKIVLIGSFNAPQGRVIRLNADGTLDSDSDFTATVPSGTLEDIDIEPNGSILLAGSLSLSGEEMNGLMRFDASGSLDADFSLRMCRPGVVNDIYVLPSGKFYVGGVFTFVNGVEVAGPIVRFNADGTLDNAFSLSGLTLLTSIKEIHTIGVQSDESVVVGGVFVTFGSDAIVRLTPEGAYDPSFQADTQISPTNGDGVFKLVVLSDDKIIVAGKFTAFNGVERTNLVRLNADGTLDPAFNPDNEYSAPIVDFDIRSSDGFLCLAQNELGNRAFGSLTDELGRRIPSFDLLNRFGVQRMDAAVFTPGGKMLFGGSFTSFDGEPTNQRMVLVDDNGVRDESFPDSPELERVVQSLSSDGDRVLVGRAYSSQQVSDVKLLDIMHYNGAVMPGVEIAFESLGGAQIRVIRRIQDAYLVGGFFNSVNGVSFPSIVRIEAPVSITGSPSNLSAVPAGFPKRVELSWEDHSTNETAFQIQRFGPEDGDYITIGFAEADATTFADLTPAQEGQLYLYRVRAITLFEESEFTNEAQAVALPDPPATPTGLTSISEAATASEITLAWNDNADNETAFEVYRRSLTDADFSLLGSVAANDTSFVDAGLSSGTGYVYRVRAINDGGGSDYSDEYAGYTLPLPPSDFQASELSATEIVLTWSFEGSITSVSIYRSINDNSNYELVEEITCCNGQIAVDGLQEATRYFWRVKALNPAGASDFSDELETYTLPETPENLTAERYGVGKARLAWTDKSEKEAGYRIYRLIDDEHVLLTELPEDSEEAIVEVEPNGTSKVSVVAYTMQNESAPVQLNDVRGIPVSAGDWTREIVEEVPARSDAVAFVIDDNAFIGLGWDGNTVYKDFWRFDPATNEWTRVADFPGTARVGAVAFVLNGRGYVGTGNDFSGVMERDFYAYDPATDSWQQVADFPEDFASGGGITSGAAFVINNYGYVGLGNTGVNSPKAFFRYDPVNDVWEERASFPGPGRTGAVGFSAWQRGFFGFGDGGASSNRSDMWEYEPNADEWTQKPDYPGAGRSGACVLLSSPEAFSVSIVHGEEGDFFSTVSTNKATLFRLVESSNQWDDEYPVVQASARSHAVAFWVGGSGYVFSGRNGNTRLNDLLIHRTSAYYLPGSPTPASVEYISESALRLSWSPSKNASEYIIWVSVNGEPFQPLVTLPQNTTEYLHEGLAPETEYAYGITCQNRYGTYVYYPPKVVTEHKPMAPSELMASDINETYVTITWQDNSTNEKVFEILVAKDGEEVSRLTTEENQTQAVVTGLSPLTEYTISVRAKRQYAASDFVETTVTTVDYFPNAPVSLSAVLTAPKEVTLTWTDKSDNETGFVIRRTGADESEVMFMLDPNTTTYLDPTVMFGGQYTYALWSVNSRGSSDTTTTFIRIPDLTVPPSAPTNLYVAESSQVHALLRWTDSSDNELGFRLKRRENDGDFVLLAELPENSLSYLDDSFRAGIQYEYQLTAFNDAGDSDVAFRSYKKALTVPNAPTDLKASIKDGKVELTWTDNANNESKFEIVRSNEPEPYAVVDADMTTFLDSIFWRVENIYKVRAVNDAGASNFSEAVTVVLTDDIITTVPDSYATQAVYVYPNPVANKVVVTNTGSRAVTLHVVNALGVRFREIDLDPSADVELDASEWAAGLYIFRAPGIAPIKVMKE